MVEVHKIVAELDKEISRLKEARALLAGTSIGHYGGSTRKSTVGRRKSTMSAEGRSRIAEAMKKRWAERRKQSGKK
jgi:hypothetical protein